MNADRVKQDMTGGGTGTLTAGSAITNFVTMATAGLSGKSSIPYLLEWSGGWELGRGALNGGGTTFTRTTVTKNNIGNTTRQSVPGSGVTLSVCAQAADLVASGFDVAPTAPDVGTSSQVLCIGSGSTIGSSCDNAQVFGIGASATTAPDSLTIGIGAQSNAAGACSILSNADQYGMYARSRPGIGGRRINWEIKGIITGATPTDLFLDNTATNSIRATVPSGLLWFAQIFVVGIITTGGSLGVSQSRELRLQGTSAGQRGTTQATAIISESGFTGTSTASFDSSGHLKITVTGIASQEITWMAHVNIVELGV